MNEKEILQKIKMKVLELLKMESTGHDFYHIQRVVNNSIQISKTEESDEY